MESGTPTMKLWPCKEDTRPLVVKNLAKNLVTPSIWPRNCVYLSDNEADKEAKRIEAAAYDAANQDFLKDPNVDGSAAMELYAKECSRLMVEVMNPGHVGEIGIFDQINETIGGTSTSNTPDPPKETDAVKKLSLSKECRYTELCLRNPSFGQEAAAVAQLIFSSATGQPIFEVVNIFSVAAEGNTQQRYLNLSNNVLCEKRVSAFDASLASQFTIEEQLMLKPEEVGEKLLNFLKKTGIHTKLCVRSTSFCREAAALVAQPISSIKHNLRDVELSDFVSGRGYDEALEVMLKFSSALEGSELRYLNLSNNAVLDEKGIRAVGALLKSQIGLEELYLLNDGISENVIRDLIPPTNKLKVLQFHGDSLNAEGVKSISEIVTKCPLLEDFRCSNSNAHSKGSAVLAEALGNCKRLKKLDVRFNRFNDAATLPLSMAILVFSDLSEIYLSYTNLYDEGCIAVANALKDSSSPLQILDVAGNFITDGAASALASCIQSKQGLTKLNLAANVLKSKGAELISVALLEGTHNHLSEVNLQSNVIGTDGAIEIAKAVLCKPQLKVLNITQNAILPDEWTSKLEVVFQGRPGVLVPMP